jgi:hypothetical protein
MEFCFKAFFTHLPMEKRDALLEKLKGYGLDASTDLSDENSLKAIEEVEKNLTPEEQQVLSILQGRRMVREDVFNIDNFALDSIDGLSPNMVHGNLGLRESGSIQKESLLSTSYLEGKTSRIKAPQHGVESSGSLNGHAVTS